MLKKNIRYLTISDVHLGHQRTSTLEIIDHLDEYFGHYTPYSYFTELDILFIAGDLFDSLLEFSDQDTYLINLWIARVARFCSKYNIKLRVLEGTPTHDWRQSKIIKTIIDMMQVPIDYLYVQELYIEYMDDLGLTILYVPDEWTPKAETTLTQVKDLMKLNHLQQVDIAIMHGMFQHQCEMGRNFHDASEYLSLVKYYINIGHIHTFSFFNRIIAQGSFDRLAHNEEEPKGGVLVSINKDDNRSFDFIENKLAKTYKTIEFRSKDTEQCFSRLEKILKTLRPGSYVRIKTTKDHPFYSRLEDLKLKYIDFNFSRIHLDESDANQQQKSLISPISYNYEPINIHQGNIKTLLLAEIQNQHSLTPSQMLAMDQLLESSHV